jgi:hypothetical protein
MAIGFGWKRLSPIKQTAEITLEKTGSTNNLIPSISIRAQECPSQKALEPCNGIVLKDSGWRGFRGILEGGDAV